MRVVIDTNVLWVSVSRRSASHWLFEAILNGSITLCVTTDILEEYAEIMSLKLGSEASETVLSVFDNLPNIQNGIDTIEFANQLRKTAWQRK